MEIERKFLVKELPASWKVFGSEIRQGYFSLRPKDVEIRLRQKGRKYFITIKSGQGRVRLEEEIPISKQRFETLWPLVRNACVFKRRYQIRYANRNIELDVYEACLRGLMTAEVEFSSKRESESFEPPAWLGREITGNRRFANESLARRGRI